ncbi:methylglyoxal reductase (NADPH-dependent) gre2 [Tulasnella sp. 330]|nr:methylglyoxal reductase (NADPH-dependent) gre2 [Tulasnella sp. 330]
MPIAPAPAKVLVTGASGFLGVWVCNVLLDKGYRLAGTVRSQAKGKYLEDLFQKAGFGKGLFEIIVVEDIAQDGAFDHAVVGIDAVVHTASPVTLVHTGDPEEIIQPTVRGTVGILSSLKKHSPYVKRVVITSSYAAILTSKKPGPGQEVATIDESDWNTLSAIEVEQKGRGAGGLQIYRASKVLAERAAWNFVEQNKDSISFDLVTICPPMLFLANCVLEVYGPMLHEVNSPSSLGSSLNGFRNNVLLANKTEEELLAPANTTGYWVDVRDVAMIHALALVNPSAGGERFITATGLRDVPTGSAGKGRNPKVPAHILATKAEKTFDFKFRGIDDTIPETFRAIRNTGL